MTSALKSSLAGTILLLFSSVGFAGGGSTGRESLEDAEQTLSTEVIVTIAMPSGLTAKGVVVVTLEDITLPDVPAKELARVRVATSALQASRGSVVVPVDLKLIKSNAMINAAVHIDIDNNGIVSDGDWISDSIVLVITNSKMRATIDVVKVGT